MQDAKKNALSNRRAEIVAIATEAFLENGYSGTSMAQLAKACDIQKASFYHHFPSKDALFITCVNEGYAGAVKGLVDIRSDPSLTDWDKIERAVHNLYESIVTSPAGRFSPLIAEVSRMMPGVADDFHKDYITHQRAALEGIVLDGVRNGAFKEQDFDIFHHLVFGPIVTLSLSREMFAQVDDLDAHFPVEKLERGHLEIIVRELRV